MKKSLTRSIPYWLLLVLSLASAGVGGWIVSDNTATMTARLLDGTATGVEVYVGQPWIVLGAILLGAGVIGILLTLALAAARTLIPAASPVVVEPIDPAADAEDAPAAPETSANETVDVRDEESAPTEDEVAEEDQNGSSGSIATATNISVR